jgi:hypothetical protein
MRGATSDANVNVFSGPGPACGSRMKRKRVKLNRQSLFRRRHPSPRTSRVAIDLKSDSKTIPTNERLERDDARDDDDDA